MVSRRDPWAWAGIAVVGLTAIVWSFAALSDLAHMVGVTTVIDTWWGWQLRIAWGLPITVDVLAVVATRVWLRGTAPAEAITYACRAAWAAIGASIVGNGYHGLLVGNFQIDALIVSAVPAVVIGAIVHLAVLVGRPPKKEPTDEGSTPDRSDKEADQEPFVWLTDETAALDYAALKQYADRFPPDPTVPDRPEASPPATDGQIIDAMKQWASDLGRRPSRDEMLERYKIGATRCRRLRNMVGWIEPTEQADRVPTESVGADR